MTLQRISTTELGRLLNSAAQPIYVLDDELTIVFVNRACQDWLATDELLIGRRCGYHSCPDAGGADAVAAGLCPPPQVLNGHSPVAIVSRTSPDGILEERRAKFLPIGTDGESLLGVLAIVDSVGECHTPLTEGLEDTAPPREPAALHEHVRRFRQEAAARYRADRLIGQGTAMRLARRQVELAANSQSSVLLVGPPGSGRRHLASAIHYAANPPTEDAPSQAGTLTPLDCSLLGADLLEAIVAAVARAKLLADESRPGTLLLHRVDDLSADLQVELAAFIVRRPQPWRLIATAAESLLELARRGKFRDDLAAALSTLVIELPPLNARRDDLPLLAQLLLEDLNAAGQRQIGGFTSAALDLMDSYGWPGNIEELAEAIAEAHGRAASHEIDVQDLPEKLRLVGRAAAHPRRTEETIVLGEYLGRVERELIRRALARAKGNKARAARLLGMTRPRLYRRMVQLGLEERREGRGERGAGKE